MKINQKIGLFTFTMLGLLAAALVMIGSRLTDTLIHNLNEATFSRELGNINISISESVKELREARLYEIKKYVVDEKESLLQKLKNFSFGKTGQLLILDRDLRVVLHPDLPRGASYDHSFTRTMLQEASGNIRYHYNGRDRFAAFLTTSQWDWLLVLSIDEAEILSPKERYTRYALLATLISFLSVFTIAVFLSRAFHKQVGLILMALSQIKAGNLEFEIAQVSNDELGEIQQNLNITAQTLRKQREELQITLDKLQAEISERKQVEKSLAENRDRFLAMLEESPIGVGVSRVKDGHINYVNKRLAEMFGSSVEELMGITGPDFWFDTADRDEFIRSFNANGRVSGTSIKLKKRDGSPFWSMLTWEKAETFGEGRILFWVYDISDLKNTQLELLAAKETADKANQAKSEFLSSMSHDLRTPLNGILGFAQLLEYDPTTPLTDRQKDSTDQIMKSGYHLLELIDQVLELAQIEAGKISMNIEDVSLRELLDECVPLVVAMADKRGITLDSGSAGCEGIFVRADHTRLKQIVLNLLSNAVKYNREKGSISVDVRAVDGGMMHVAVSDTGPGIPEDLQDDLFKPFERLGQETSEIEGTGIGLIITRDLVRLMDGEIGFESEVGKGSTFWIEVPVAVDVHERQVADSADTADDVDLGASVGDPTKRYTVLYVEDNPANLALMEHIFEGVPNMDLISTHTAELGIEMAESQGPDLILMDINLPGMDGIEALGRLKKLEQTSHIPVIAISAAAMPHQVEKGKEAGFDAYLTKPLQFDKLFDAMSGALKAE